MPIFILVIIVLVFVYGPHYWASHVLKKYNKEQYFSGNGIELAQLLLERMNMRYVKVEEIEKGDHYDPIDKTLRLSSGICGRRSLTAVVVVAAHEVGHAVQEYAGYRPLHTRTKMILTAQKMERVGAVLMLIVPMITLVTRIPAAGLLILVGGFANLCVPFLVHLITLPVEFDASFNRALPMLDSGNLIPPEDMPAARKILMACALTYAASALMSLLNIWRWIRILRR